ncbi:MAG: fibronectin type III domain-containing protein [Fibrobacteres bacterium]|nr:fibronectin type III domain-containing protein [Fibrobacterota bacterium]
MQSHRLAWVVALTALALGSAWADPVAPDSAPQAIHPQSGQVNVALDASGGVTVEWDSVPRALAYELQVGSPTFGFIIPLFTVQGPFTTFTVPHLQRGIGYIWQVRGKNAGGDGPWSQTLTFSTEPLKPPELVSPALTNIAPKPSVRFAWTEPNPPAFPASAPFPTAGGYTYQLQVCTDPAFPLSAFPPMPGFPPLPPYVIDMTIAAPFLTENIDTAMTGFSYGKTYYWRVKTAIGNTAGSEWSMARAFTTSPPPPSTITFLNPAPGAVDVPASPTLKWTDTNRPIIPGTSGTGGTLAPYWLRLATDSTFPDSPVPIPAMNLPPTAPYLINESLYDTTRVVTPALLPGTKYYWRVMVPVIYGGDESFASGSFTVMPLPPEMPVTIAPAAGASDVPLTGPLQWGAAERAKLYRCQIGTNAAFSDPATFTENTTAGLSLELNLLPSQVYYWRVRAENGGGNSGYSQVGRFLTLTPPPVPGAPIAVAPSGAINIPLTPILIWRSTDLALTYSAQLDTNPGLAAPLLSRTGLADTTLAIGPLDRAKTYYWRVAAANAQGAGAWSTVSSFATLPKPPASPILLAPDSNAVNLPDTLALICRSVPGAEGYAFKLAKIVNKANGPELVIVDSAAGPDTAHVFGPLEKGTTYLWSALARNAGGVSISNSTRAFGTLPELPSGVTLVFPSRGDTVTGDSLIARWHSAGPTAGRYRVQVAYDSAFVSPIGDSLILDTLKPITFAAGNGRYWWRVQAWNAAGWGPYGEAYWFQVDNPTTGLAGSLRITPGFGGGGAILRYALADASRVTISLFDVQGRDRGRPLDGIQAAGPHTLSLEGSSATHGWYLLRFEAKATRNPSAPGTFRKELPVFLGH